MTNEEKLKKLLEIAVENGWEDEFDFQYTLSFDSSIIKNKYIFEDCGGKGELHSLNDLVTNWEEGKISFIEALLKNTEYSVKTFRGNVIENSLDFEDEVTYPCGTDVDFYPLHHSIRMSWLLKPTSERLDWLLKIFKHIYND